MCEGCHGYFLDDGGELIHGKLLCESCSDDLVRDELELKKYFFNYIKHFWQQACENNHGRRNSDWISRWHWLDWKKVVKENFTNDPSSNVMSYAKFTAVMAGSIALKNYLQDKKILPDSV